MSWQKGVSGNPKGRPPKGETMTDTLAELAMGDKEGIAKKLIALAKKGNVAALKYVYDRIDGMPRQSVKVTGDQEQPLPLIILRASQNATST